jgi:hypothetical protein
MINHLTRTLLVLLLLACSVGAAKVTWLGTTSASPKVAANWSTVTTLPQQTDSVYFTSTNLNPCTFDSSFRWNGMFVRSGYTQTINLNGYACSLMVVDSMGSGGALNLTGTLYVGGVAANSYLKSTGTITTTGCNLVLGNNTFTVFVSTVQTWLSLTCLAGSGKTNTMSTTSAQTYGALSLTASGTYSGGSGGTIITPTICPYTWSSNGRTSTIAGHPLSFTPSAACTLHINGVDISDVSGFINLYNTTSGEVDYQLGDSIGSPYATNGFPLKSGTGALKLWTNNNPIYIGTALAGNGFIFGNSNATGDDSIWCGSSTIKVGLPTSTANNAGNTWLMMQTSNWVVGGFQLGSNTHIVPGTSSLTINNSSKTVLNGVLTLAGNSLYQVYLRSNAGVHDSIVGTLRVTNLEQDSGFFNPGIARMILAGNAIFKAKTAADSTRIMRYDTMEFTNAASCEWGNVAGRRVDSLTMMLRNNFTHTLDTSIVNIRSLLFTITGNVTYTQTAAKTLGYFVNGAMSGSAGDTISYVSSSAGNRTYFQPPSAQAVTYAMFKDFAAKNFPIWDSGAGGNDGTNDSNLGFMSNQGSYLDPIIPTAASASPNVGSIAGGYPVTFTCTNMNSAWFRACSLSVNGAAYFAITTNNANSVTATMPSGSVGAATLIFKNCAGYTVTSSAIFSYISAAHKYPIDLFIRKYGFR